MQEKGGGPPLGDPHRIRTILSILRLTHEVIAGHVIVSLIMGMTRP